MTESKSFLIKLSIFKFNLKYSKILLIYLIYSFIKKILKNDEILAKDFEYISVLGKGAFGEVLLVQYKEDKKYYAMKILSKERVIQYNMLKYAKLEKDVMQLMTHPFIVKLRFAF